MADEKTQENDTEEEYVILETPPEDPAKDKPADSPDDGPDDDDHDDDEGDTRLATSDDDHEEDIKASANAQRRKERRERQRRAREQQQMELDTLRQQVGYLSQRVAQQETHVVGSLEQDIVRQYHQTVQEARQAEAIMAKALEAQNGEDHVAAMRIRDAAANRAAQLNQQYNEIQQQKAQPRFDPNEAVVSQHRQEWLAANPWFDNSGTDPDSAAVRAIDARMQQEGLNPADRRYWQELSRRASQHFTPERGNGAVADDVDDPPLRKAPPQGGKREHAPVSTRKEIYVTPERKQAMIDAGVWDDPARRNRMLKAYAEYDRDASGR